MAYGQRRRKRQPGGGSTRSGGAPGMLCSSVVSQGDDRAQQALGVGVRGLGEDLARGALLDDAAGVHHRHPVARLGHDPEVVRDEDEPGVIWRRSARMLEDLGLDDRRRARSSARRRRPPPVEHDRQGDHDPLAHPAGELVRVVLHPGQWDAHRHQRSGRSLGLVLLDAGPVGLQRLDEVVLHRISGFSRVIGSWKMRAMSSPRARAAVGVERRPARRPERTLPGEAGAAGEEADEAPTHRRLAAAGLAHQPEALAGCEHEVDTVDRDRAPARWRRTPAGRAPRARRRRRSRRLVHRLEIGDPTGDRLRVGLGTGALGPPVRPADAEQRVDHVVEALAEQRAAR